MTRARRMRCLPVLLITLFSCGFVRAQQEPPSPLGYIRDFANVLDPASLESIDDLSYRLENWTGAHIDIFTVRSLPGTSNRRAGLSLFGELHNYPAADNERLLIVFVLNENRFVVVSGTRLQSILSPKINIYKKEANALLRQHRYASAVELLTRRIAEAIASDAQVRLKPVDYSAALGDWSPAVQPHDVLAGCVVAMVLLWTILIPLILIVRRIRARSPEKRELVTSLGIANLQS